MNDINPTSGELIRSISPGKSLVDIGEGLGFEGTGFRTTTMAQRVPAAPLDLESQSHGTASALRRRLPLALGLAILVSGLSTGAAWFLLPPPKFKAQSRLQVSSQVPQVAFKTSEAQYDTADSYRRLQKTQLNLVKSRFVINAALQAKEVANIPMIKEQPDPIDWLQENLQAQFLQESELLEIALSGDSAEEVADVVNAITKAYIDEVVNQDHMQRQTRLDMLKRISRSYADMTKDSPSTAPHAGQGGRLGRPANPGVGKAIRHGSSGVRAKGTSGGSIVETKTRGDSQDPASRGPTRNRRAGVLEQRTRAADRSRSRSERLEGRSQRHGKSPGV